jgi:hypothetical protein
MVVSFLPVDDHEGPTSRGIQIAASGSQRERPERGYPGSGASCSAAGQDCEVHLPMAGRPLEGPDGKASGHLGRVNAHRGGAAPPR